MNELLNVAQIDVGHLALRKDNVNVVELVGEILREYATTFESKNQEVQFMYRRNSKFLVVADKVKLGMALENIIGNASKFSPSDTKIEIGLFKNERELTVTVKDEGVGIAKKDIRKLFRKFSRIEGSQSVAIGGMGLGLYWAKKIIDMYGGSISVESEPNQGSTFSIKLPITKSVKKAKRPLK
jgi:signal transduction histidine kinase